jgi:hypothetical protein
MSRDIRRDSRRFHTNSSANVESTLAQASVAAMWPVPLGRVESPPLSADDIRRMNFRRVDRRLFLLLAVIGAAIPIVARVSSGSWPPFDV